MAFEIVIFGYLILGVENLVFQSKFGPYVAFEIVIFGDLVLGVEGVDFWTFPLFFEFKALTPAIKDQILVLFSVSNVDNDK